MLAKNGRNAVISRSRSPEALRIYQLKQQLGLGLRWLEKNGHTETLDKIKAKLRYAAHKRPDLFGKWALL